MSYILVTDQGNVFHTEETKASFRSKGGTLDDAQYDNSDATILFKGGNLVQITVKKTLHFGRSARNGVTSLVLNPTCVAPSHCFLDVEKGLKDLKSPNGTFVSNAKVKVNSSEIDLFPLEGADISIGGPKRTLGNSPVVFRVIQSPTPKGSWF